MRTYGKIESAFWLNPKVKKLSDDAKLLLLYIYTCPHGNSVGCFVLHDGYICSDLGWSLERVTERVTELVSKQVIERDTESDTLLVKGWFGHNSIENKNVAMNAAKTIMTLPKSYIISSLINILSEHEKPFVNGIVNMLPNTFLNTLPNLLPNVLGIRARVPEPKPEPEPEPKPKPDALTNAFGNALPKTETPPEPKQYDDEKGEGKINGEGEGKYPATQPPERAEEVFRYITHRMPNLKKVPGSILEISGWLNNGADPELDIYPTIEHCITYKRGNIGSFSYFTSSIISSIYSRQQAALDAQEARKHVEQLNQGANA